MPPPVAPVPLLEMVVLVMLSAEVPLGWKLTPRPLVAL